MASSTAPWVKQLRYCLFHFFRLKGEFENIFLQIFHFPHHFLYFGAPFGGLLNVG